MKDKKDLSRREFLKDSAAAGAGLASPGPPQVDEPGTVVKPRAPDGVMQGIVVVVKPGNVLEVVVVASEVVVVVGAPAHGFGAHVPGPISSPPAAPHTIAGTRMQLSKAPAGDDCTQHRTGIGNVLLVVVVAVTAVVVVDRKSVV